jgi:beta-glucosidase
VQQLVGNVVRAIIGSGLADSPIAAPSSPSSAQHRALARETAVAGSVLLKNEKAALPITDHIGSLAVIGPAGWDALFVGGGAAAVAIQEDRAVTPVAAIRERAAATLQVRTAQGSYGDVPLPTVPAENLTLPDESGPGVRVYWRSDSGSKWSSLADRVDYVETQGLGNGRNAGTPC